MTLFDLSLYLVIGSGDCAGRPVHEVVAAALFGGVTAVQLREKRGSDRQRYEVGMRVKAVIDQHNAANPGGIPVLFLVNDRLDLALALGAGGVHVGQDDLPLGVCRRIGPNFVLGTSVETQSEAQAAWQEGANYVGTGPIYATATKGDAGEPYGPQLVSRIKAAVSLPVVAIGGIKAENAQPVVAAGADGLAVVSAIAAAPDPAAAASRMWTIIQAVRS